MFRSGYTIRDQYAAHFLTFTVCGFIDLLTRKVLHQFKYYGNRNSKNEDYQIWTNNNHPEECITKAFTDVKINYIHQNPVRAGIVELQEHYIYSSAANYIGQKGIIDIEVLD